MKPNLLLLHGALGSKEQFTPIIPLLKQDYEVHTLNFEGHGGLATESAFSIDLFSRNVVDYLKAQKLTSVSIFGYSMGGYVALLTALQFPGLIKKVITLGTKFNWTEESSTREVKMLNPAVIGEKVPRFAENLSNTHHPLDWKENMNKTAQMMLALGNGARLSDADLGKIQQEIIIGVGDLDRMVSIEESQNAAKIIPNASLHVLKNVKHPIDQVEPAVIVQFILNNT